MLHSVVWDLVLNTFYLLIVGVVLFLHLDPLSKTTLYEGSVLRRDLYLTTHNTHNTQHTQKTNIEVPSGIRAHNPSKRAAAHTHTHTHTHTLNFAAIGE